MLQRIEEIGQINQRRKKGNADSWWLCHSFATTSPDPRPRPTHPEPARSVWTRYCSLAHPTLRTWHHRITIFSKYILKEFSGGRFVNDEEVQEAVDKREVYDDDIRKLVTGLRKRIDPNGDHLEE